MLRRMPKRALARTSRTRETATEPTPREVSRPLDNWPEVATDFRLRIGGKEGRKCTITKNGGVETENIPIALFTTDEIRARWGNHADYSVAFSSVSEAGTRIQQGGWRRFGLKPLTRPEDESATQEEHGTSLALPAGNPLGETMALMMTMRGMVSADANALAAGVEARANASLQAERDWSDRNATMMLEMFRLVHAPARSGESETVTALLAEMREERREMRRTIDRLLEERDELPDEPDEPEETDDERVDRLAKLVKQKGPMAAVQAFMGDESAAGFVRLLPKIKSKLPELARAVQPLLKDLWASLADAPAPQPNSAPVARTAPPPAAPAPPAVNGQPPLPRRRAVLRDKDSPTIE